MEIQAFDKEGRTAGREILGATMYTCVVWVVNLQMALAINYFTLIQHIFICGTIVVWYIFIIVYGTIPPGVSTIAYKVFTETLAPSPSYWILTLFVVISTIIPYLSYSAIKMQFFPFYHEMIQWIRYEGKTNDPEFCHMVRQRSLRPTTVGPTARLAAKTNSIRESSTNQIWWWMEFFVYLEAVQSLLFGLLFCTIDYSYFGV